MYFSDSDASPNYDDYEYYDDGTDDWYDEYGVGWSQETGRNAEVEPHVRQKQLEEVQAARKYLQEGTRSGNIGGDTAFGASYDQELYSDLILSVGDRTFFAHRLVLCAWSDVFKTMLSDPTWKPHNRSGQAFRQALVEEDPDARVFGDFLKFLYTATVSLTSDNVLSLVRLADKYMIPELHGLCSEFIHNSSSDVETMLALLPTAHEFNMPDIVKLCHQSLLTNFNLLSSQQLLDIDEATMLLVLDSGPELVVESEYAVFEKIEPWLNQCKDEDIFVKIIKCIRFQFMNALQLLKVTTTAVFSRASEKLPHLPLEVWQQQTLFREGSQGDLLNEFSGPRLYLRQPSSLGSEGQIRGLHRTNERNVIVTVGSSTVLRVSPWIKKVHEKVGEKQIFNQEKDQELCVLVTKVSQDQIEIKLSSVLPSLTQKYHTAIVIAQPKQPPRYFKASDIVTRHDTESSRKIGSVTSRWRISVASRQTTILFNRKTKLTQPVEEGEALEISAALIIEMQEHGDSDSKTLPTESGHVIKNYKGSPFFQLLVYQVIS